MLSRTPLRRQFGNGGRRPHGPQGGTERLTAVFDQYERVLLSTGHHARPVLPALLGRPGREDEMDERDAQTERVQRHVQEGGHPA